jgi:hypothetical protein
MNMNEKFMNAVETLELSKTTRLSVGHVRLVASLRNNTSVKDREFIYSLFAFMEQYENSHPIERMKRGGDEG